MTLIFSVRLRVLKTTLVREFYFRFMRSISILKMGYKIPLWGVKTRSLIIAFRLEYHHGVVNLQYFYLLYGFNCNIRRMRIQVMHNGKQNTSLTLQLNQSWKQVVSYNMWTSMYYTAVEFQIEKGQGHITFITNNYTFIMRKHEGFNFWYLTEVQKTYYFP